MPVTVNCVCGKVFRVKDELAGKDVTCQVCGRFQRAPALVAAAVGASADGFALREKPAAATIPRTNPVSAPWAASTPAAAKPAPSFGRGMLSNPAAEPKSAVPGECLECGESVALDAKICPHCRYVLSTGTVACPSCAEDVLVGAKFCPFCDESLKYQIPVDGQAALLQDTLERLDKHLANPQALAEDVKIKGRFMSVTSIVCASLLGAGILAGALSVLLGQHSRGRSEDTWVVVGVIAFITAAIMLLALPWSLFSDYKANSISNASTPEGALKNFYTALRGSNANKAFVALAPTARTTGPVKLVEFNNKKMPTHRARLSIRDFKTFKEYWKTVFKSPPGITEQRTVRLKRVKTIRRIGANAAMVGYELRFTSQSNSAIGFGLIGALYAMATTKKDTLKLQKLLLQRDGKWFIGEAELNGRLDNLTI